VTCSRRSRTASVVCRIGSCAGSAFEFAVAGLLLRTEA
jgi:hypothetical protein